MRAIVAVASILLFLPPLADACSISVSTYFAEVARSFSVAVQFEGKPLAAVNVTVYSFDTLKPVSTATTARDGMVRFRDLRPGKYTIEVGHLGVSAAYDQIEIRTRVSSGAKSRLDYRWGEAPTAVQRVSGKLIDIRRQGADIIERLTSAPVETPIRSALIQLRHPNNGSVYTDESDEHGEFGVVGVPNGIYVMHVRGGVTPGDSANFLVQVTPAATKESLQLFRGELCGGTAIQLQP